MDAKIGTILPPKLPKSIPNNSQWLSGQGVGTWFYIAQTTKKNEFLIQRFTPEGVMDCNRIFQIEESTSTFDINKPYQFTHISHCSKCRIIQNDVIFTFNSISN
jgi:hypothetical protein